MQGNKKRFFGIVLVALAMVGFYVVTRLTNLTALPIFTDEAIYIRWSQIGSQDANWRFISLTDGKQPMFTWVIMMLLKLVDADPLFVGRLTSVVAGFGTLLGIWAVTYILFTSVRVAFVASALYLLSPFTLLYDRMALYDSMVSMFSIWNLYLTIILVRKGRLDTALLLGLLLGAGMLNKSSGFLSLYLLPFSTLLFDFKKEKVLFRLVRFVGLVVVSFVLSQAVYSVLRLSPFFHMVGQKDSVFLFTLSEWFDQPFRYLVGNMRGMFDWLRSYLTLPIFIASFAPLFFITTKWRERLVLYMWWAIPFVGLATFAKVLYPRFTLFMTIPLFIVAADTIVKIWERMRRPIVKVVFVFVLIVPSSMVSYVVIRDPWNAPLPFSDRAQYLEDWPSGWGIPHVVSFLKTEANNHHITVFTDGTFGLLPYALEIYLVSNPNITIVGIWPLPDSVPTQVIEAIQKGPTYLVLNEKQTPPKDWYVTLLGQYEKGKREGKYMRLYTIELPPSHIL
ncbi:MAG: glycosyltransferase family 39 protein [Patescibacteria group bacterium]